MGPGAHRLSGLITGSPTLSLKGQPKKEDEDNKMQEKEGNLSMTGTSNASSQDQKLLLASGSSNLEDEGPAVDAKA